MLYTETDDMAKMVAEGQRGVNVLAAVLERSLKERSIYPYWAKIGPEVDGEWRAGPTAWRVYVERGGSEGLLLRVEAHRPEDQEYHLAAHAKVTETDRATHRRMYKLAEMLASRLNGIAI